MLGLKLNHVSKRGHRRHDIHEYLQCRMKVPLSSKRNGFNNLRHLNSEKWQNMKINPFLNSPKQIERNATYIFWIDIITYFTKTTGGNRVMPLPGDFSVWMKSFIHSQTSTMQPLKFGNALQWRHNEHNGVSNQQPHGCLLNRLFRKHQKLRATGLCAGNFYRDRWIPRTYGQQRGKCFPLMTSSWISYFITHLTGHVMTCPYWDWS